MGNYISCLHIKWGTLRFFPITCGITKIQKSFTSWRHSLFHFFHVFSLCLGNNSQTFHGGGGQTLPVPAPPSEGSAGRPWTHCLPPPPVYLHGAQWLSALLQRRLGLFSRAQLGHSLFSQAFSSFFLSPKCLKFSGSLRMSLLFSTIFYYFLYSFWPSIIEKFLSTYYLSDSTLSAGVEQGMPIFNTSPSVLLVVFVGQRSHERSLALSLWTVLIFNHAPVSTNLEKKRLLEPLPLCSLSSLHFTI